MEVRRRRAEQRSLTTKHNTCAVSKLLARRLRRTRRWRVGYYFGCIYSEDSGSRKFYSSLSPLHRRCCLCERGEEQAAYCVDVRGAAHDQVR